MNSKIIPLSSVALRRFTLFINRFRVGNKLTDTSNQASKLVGGRVLDPTMLMPFSDQSGCFSMPSTGIYIIPQSVSMYNQGISNRRQSSVYNQFNNYIWYSSICKFNMLASALSDSLAVSTNRIVLPNYEDAQYLARQIKHRFEVTTAPESICSFPFIFEQPTKTLGSKGIYLYNLFEGPYQKTIIPLGEEGRITSFNAGTVTMVGLLAKPSLQNP